MLQRYIVFFDTKIKIIKIKLMKHI